MKERLFSQKEINAIFRHTPSRTLRSWAEEGYLDVAAKEEDGRGIHRKYSRWNLFQIAMITELAQLGQPFRRIKRILEEHFMDSDYARAWGGISSLDEIGGKFLVISFGLDRSITNMPYHSSKLISQKDMTPENTPLKELFGTVYGLKDHSQPWLIDVHSKEGRDPSFPSSLIIISLEELVRELRFVMAQAELE